MENANIFDKNWKSLTKPSKLEIERNLEQMRALENNTKIHVGFTSSKPLSIDTQNDLIKIKKIMEKNGKN